MVQERSPRARLPRRRRDFAELGVGYGLILAVLWTPVPYQRHLYGVAAAFLVFASIRPGANWRALGLSTRNLIRAGVVPLLAGLFVAGCMSWAAHNRFLHAPATPSDWIRRFWGYAVWSFAQQFLLQNFFLLRLQRLLPERSGMAIGLSAGLFALAHVPNPILTLATFVWGLLACSAFVRYRSLYPLGLAHAMLGICLAVCLPGRVTHNMRVGLGYLTYHHKHPYRRKSDHTVSTRV